MARNELVVSINISFLRKLCDVIYERFFEA